MSAGNCLERSLSIVVASLRGMCGTVLLLISACQAPVDLTKQHFSGQIMGTQYRVTVVYDKGELGQKTTGTEDLHGRLLKQMRAVDTSMSTYRSDSEINKINRVKANESLKLSADLAQVLAISKEVFDLSAGAFDITVAPLVDLWGFGANSNGQALPTEQEISKAKRTVGFQHLSMLAMDDGIYLSKSEGQIRLDLSAVAKGYAVDLVADELSRLGINNYLIDIGGELRAKGQNEQGEVWRIGLEKPDTLGGLQTILALENQAIATSGDYLNFVLHKGERYSHTIDPVTASPVLHKLASVSVIDDSAARADALATALMVMGDEKGLEFVEAHNIAAHFVIRLDGETGLTVKKSTKFRTIYGD